ncbi:phage tail tape measure protein [Clostridium sp. WILCCON 0269]|uniref:Phage tail tape measure protein n=1 Tax=Candidatus Clostridium eludens TaxID=3381663 RepID=A0ABW8SMJ7_9CLOT
MAIDAGTVVAFMELDTSRFTGGLSSAGEQMKQFMNSNNSAETRIQSLSGAMQGVGSVATTAVTLPLVGIGTAAVKTSMDFGAQMSKVQAISGATGNEFNKLREQAIQLGADTNFSATEAAEGQENLASAGFKTNEILSAMPGMLSLAAAGDVDIATAADIAGSSLRGFGMEASQATHVADVLAKTAADTNAGITDTGEAMKYIAPVAHSLGISFEDTTAAIGLLSNAGIKGSQAGTTLRGALTSLASPTKAASAVMEELGMNFFDAHGKMLPLGDVIQQLKDKTSGLTQQQKASAMETLFGKEAMSGMLALVDQGPDKFRSLEKELKNCDGAGKEMADTMQNNLKGAIEAMKGSIETMGIRIGDVLAPGIKKAADFIAALANGFSNLPKPIQTVIVYLGIAAAAFGPVMLIFSKVITSTATVVGAVGKIGTAMKAMGSAFTRVRSAASAFSALPGLISPPVLITVGIIAGLALIVYEVIKHWDSFKKYAAGFGNAIKSIFKAVGEFISAAVKGWGLIFTGFSKLLKISVEGWIILFKGFGAFIKAAVEGWKLIFSGLGNVMKAIGKFIFEGLFQGISSMAGKIKDKVASIAGSIKEVFTSHLGIHSPSTVFTEYAVNTGQGYIIGMDKMENPIKQRLLRWANGIKNLGKTKPDFSKLDDIALSGAYSGSSKETLNRINNLSTSKILDFNPKITLYVTVADTGEKGTKKLAGEVKSMTGNALKDAMAQLFMNDVLRD